MPRTLLLADDSVTIQKVVSISFANEDIQLVTVDNGDAAIAKARELRPDIVLADVVMPGKSGYEVCAAIKGDPELAGTPVLLLTGTFETFDRERAAQAGADGHITKPFEAQALVDQVNQRLAEARTPAVDPLGLTQIEPPAPTAEQAYDLFEDEVTAPSELRDAPAPPTTVLMTEPGLPPVPTAEDDDRAAQTWAEDFGSDSGSASTADRRPGVSSPAGAEELPASLFDDEPEGSDPSPAFLLDEPLETEGPRGSEESAGALSSPDGPESATRLLGIDEPDAATHLFDEPLATGARPANALPEGLGLLSEEDPLMADLADMGQGTLDPIAGREYDVSSSDLGAPAAEEGAPGLGALAPEAPAQAEPVPLPSAPAWPAEPEPGMAAAEPRPELDAGAPYPAETIAILPEAEMAEPNGPVTEGTPAALTPLLEQQLHQQIEKLAWDAFGGVAEQIVKDAVERIERVAWEVIPQMAETLIREEIRKLKDGS